MTKKEYVEKLAEVQRKLAEAKRQNEILLDIENERHSDAVRNEDDRHRKSVAELKTEYYEENQRLMAEQAELRSLWAAQRDEEQRTVTNYKY